MNEQQRKFESYLNEQITACKQHSKLLAEEDRMDEGTFEKIRANIFEIFKTILSIAERTFEKDDSAKRSFFLQKAEQIPANWSASYEKTKQNGVIEKMHVESITLNAIREIKDVFLQIWEEPT